MDWQSQLITLYLNVCELYRQELWVHVQRFAPYADLRFTDEAVLTLYLFGILDKKREIKTLYMSMPTAIGGIGFRIYRAAPLMCSA
jgi:hypothetical protein